MTRAERIVRKKVKERYGSVLIAIALIQLAIALFRLWKDLNQARPPIEDDVAMMLDY